MAEVSSKEFISIREDAVRAALKELPPLPTNITLNYYSNVWLGTGGLVLVFNYGATLVGTPSGWIKLRSHSDAYYAAESTKNPWQALAKCGFTIPRLKKKRVWDEAMAAQLAMHVLEQDGER